MAARIFIHAGEPLVRDLAEREMRRDPEGWFQAEYRKMVERFGAEPPADAPTDSRDCLTLVHSKTPEEWQQTQQRLEAEWRQLLAQDAEKRKNAPPPPPVRRYSGHQAAMEAKQREAERKKKEDAK